MLYHEQFWVVAGAAAPVIALAEVVSLGEAFRVSTEQAGIFIEQKLREKRDNIWLYRADRTRGGAYGAAYLNLGLQFAALGLALASLAVGRDRFPLIVVMIMVPAGLVLLLISTFLTNLSVGLLQRARPLARIQPGCPPIWSFQPAC